MPSQDDPSGNSPQPQHHSPDIPSPKQSQDVEAVSDQNGSYTAFTNRNRALALFLTNAITTGKLGSGPAESKYSADAHLFTLIRRTMPWFMLFLQLIWSSIIIALAWALADKQKHPNSLSKLFWTSRLNVSSSVTSGAGWALFVLLAFYIREAANRHREAQEFLNKIHHLLIQLMRHILQVYPPGTWHHGDRERIVSHLAAYPIALKMSLRNEREKSQLAKLLHEHDLEDVINHPDIHLRCMQVVRSYFTCVEDDAQSGFIPAANKTPAGWGARYVVLDLIDSIDLTANGSVRIRDFHPAFGYLNHLNIFLYVWLFYLPITLVEATGWFTVLWSLLITYGVGMIFEIANALNEPYGFDVQDVKLSRRCAEISLNILDMHSKLDISLKTLLQGEWQTPTWLTPSPPVDAVEFRNNKKQTRILLGTRAFLASVATRFRKKSVAIPLLIFILWTAFVAFGTWAIAGKKQDPTCRWWCVYLPGDASTTGYISLGVFLLLAFVLNDAYGRYWSGLLLWQCALRGSLMRIATNFAFVFNDGVWHPGDQERIFAFLAAIPYAIKCHLRGTKDVSQLETTLCPQDLIALATARNLPAHCFHVLYAYLNSAGAMDPETISTDINPIGRNAVLYTLYYSLQGIESVAEKCDSIRKFPLNKSFTLHVKVFAAIFLCFLPITLVTHDGFFVFLYCIIIGYSIINLITLGDDLSDPFGDDADDIPLDMFCKEIRSNIRQVYIHTRGGPARYLQESDYSRTAFSPKYINIEGKKLAPKDADRSTAIRSTFKTLWISFPSVSWRAQLAITIWIFTAVGSSYGLSFLWRKELRESCSAWCSPTDVNGNVLGYTGFALFTILAFRASDAVQRYEEGAQAMYEIEKELRVIAIECVQAFPRGTWHNWDLERMIAHLTQIPLAIRDKLLGPQGRDESESLLTPEDFAAMKASGAGAFFHCMYVVQSYFISADRPDRERFYVKNGRRSITYMYNILRRISITIGKFGGILGVKRFPLVASYTKHQRLFTGLWLLLLPLAMTPGSGWLTLLSAPIISYGVLGLDALAEALVDPFGTDTIDLPIDQLCRRAVSTILQAVDSIQWGCNHHIAPSPEVGEPRLGIRLHGKEVVEDYVLASLCRAREETTVHLQSRSSKFEGPTPKKEKLTLYSHIVRSVPWWVILGIAAWATLAVFISFGARVEATIADRWSVSSLSISSIVAKYVGFATFLLLSFYVKAAYDRYKLAGSVWADKLRDSLHSLTAKWLTLFPPGTVHEGDHDRIMGHIASIPIVLKMELRDDRNLRELKGLLSQEDIGKIHCADSMTNHCIDVVRSYYFATFVNRPYASSNRVDNKSIDDGIVRGSRWGFASQEIRNLENVVVTCLFIKEFEIAPGMLYLLRLMLGIWFIIIPFVLAELSGFTIFWIVIISYGILGMYAVAVEIQQPFGNDVNDLDLDQISNSIVRDILGVQCNYRGGADTLIVDQGPHECPWAGNGNYRLSLGESGQEKQVAAKRRMMLKGRWQWARLAAHTVPWWMLGGIVVWGVIATVAAWLVSKLWKQYNDQQFCSPWFCSAIAVDSNVKEYVGFALFLLLGIRLSDSHNRYVEALKIWNEELLGMLRIISSRLFESYHYGTWHEGDLDRIAGHLAAYPITTKAELRNQDPSMDALTRVLSGKDAELVLSAQERSSYCLDVVYAYLAKGDFLKREDGKENPCGDNVHYSLLHYLSLLRDASSKCKRIRRIPMPYGFTTHLQIYLGIWLVMLPLGLVESSGWLTILWTVPIAFSVIGVERWAMELADPFGLDLSDIPLDKLCATAVDIVKTNWDENKRSGSAAFVHPERKALLTQ